EMRHTVVTSSEALRYARIPSFAIVIGAGAVGVEFASLYRSFGAEVTLIEALPRIVPLEDAEVSKELAAALAKRGITVMAGAKVEDAEKSDGGVKLTVQPSKGAV